MEASLRYLDLALILGLISSCGYFKRDEKPNSEPSEAPAHLYTRGDLYCSLSHSAYLEAGYVHSKCDGSGFTSLYSVRCPGVNLAVYSDETGKLWRSQARDCFIKGESEAESSRDMWIMRMVAAWRHRDLAWAKTALAFVEREGGVICKASSPAFQFGRCVLTPQLSALLSALKDKLETGETPPRLTLKGEEDVLPLPLNYDYQAHLDILRIWLSGEVYGAITSAELDQLRRYAERETKNALFQAVWGLYGGSLATVWSLLDAWPPDRLPGSQDWKEPYLWQRDQGTHNWEPVIGPPVAHDGADFNMALYVGTRGARP